MSATRHGFINEVLETERDFRLVFDEDLRFLNFGDADAWWLTEGVLTLHRYEGSQSPRPAFSPIVGYAMRPAETVSSDAGTIYDGDHVYWHWVESIGRGGISRATLNRLTRAVVYADGSYVGLLPNPAIHVRLAQTTDRRVVVSWVHNPLDEQAAPAAFEVFSNGGSGDVDLDTPVGSVDYVPGQHLYRWASEQYVAGTLIAFVVRAKSASGVYSLLPAHADAYHGPAQHYGELSLSEAPQIRIVERTLDDPPAPSFA